MTGSPARRILVVEDDAKLADLVREYLERNGYAVDVEPRGDRASERIPEEAPDLVVLDLMLPGMDGLEVCRRVRSSYSGPILMLTARGEEADEVAGLEIGADDYVPKPVRPRVLLARIGSLLRRVEDSAVAPRRIEIGLLAIDDASREVILDGRRVELTTAEYDLLGFLAARAGRVVPREEIFRGLRGIEWDGLDRSIDLRVARLRRKLGDDGKRPRLIKSVRGTGYMLAGDP